MDYVTVLQLVQTVGADGVAVWSQMVAGMSCIIEVSCFAIRDAGAFLFSFLAVANPVAEDF